MSVQRRSNPNGTTSYRVRWRENGRMLSRTFSRKGDADAWNLEVKRRLQLGPIATQQMTAKGPTLAEWLSGPWKQEHGITLAARTRANYRNVYENHIAADLGERALRDLTPRILRAWQADRLAAGASPGTLRQARALLSSALRHAAEAEIIAGNPLSVVRAPKLPRTDAVRPLSPSSVEAIRAAILGGHAVEVEASGAGKRTRAAHTRADARSDHQRAQDALLVSVLAYAGLRPSEALALRWSDVRESTILVERAIEADGSVKATKTGGRRTVRLLGALADDLAERGDDGDPLFSRRGKPWTEEEYRRWRSRHWRKACAAAGLEPTPRPYDLRHSFASLLLAEGATVHDVAAQLGHSPTMTLNVYGHVIDEFRGRRQVKADTEIRRARRANCAPPVPTESG